MAFPDYFTEPQQPLGTVYVVDDDEAVCDSVRWLLEAGNYKVEIFDSGESFIAKYDPQAIAVLSGGQGEDEAISEAECMYRELTARGIDGSRLYKEESSVNTPTNLRHSRAILEEALGADSTWAGNHEIALITSEFHCYRGCLHAKQEGLNPVAYASKTAMPYVIPFYLREIVAVVYTWFFR